MKNYIGDGSRHRTLRPGPECSDVTVRLVWFRAPAFVPEENFPDCYPSLFVQAATAPHLRARIAESSASNHRQYECRYGFIDKRISPLDARCVSLEDLKISRAAKNNQFLENHISVKCPFLRPR